LAGDGGVGRVELDQEDTVAPVHDLGDAFDRRFGERSGDLRITRRRPVGRTRRHRGLEPRPERRRRVVVAGWKREPWNRVEMRAPWRPGLMPARGRVPGHAILDDRESAVSRSAEP
jgi:hypothetical protein